MAKMMLMSATTTILLLTVAITGVHGQPKEILISPWTIQSYDPINANVGDTIRFVWDNEFHNVFIHPSMNCEDDTDRIEIGSSGDDGDFSYTFVAADGSSDGTSHLFVCNIGGHCEVGQNILVTVFPAEPTAAPTPVPTNAPTPTPAPVEVVDDDLPFPEDDDEEPDMTPTDSPDTPTITAAPVEPSSPTTDGNSPSGEMATPPPVDDPIEPSPTGAPSGCDSNLHSITSIVMGIGIGTIIMVMMIAV